MAILNQQKSTFVPVCTFFILQNDKTCYDFSENSDFFLKNILFRIQLHFLPSISQKNFGGIKFSERKQFFIPENVD